MAFPCATQNEVDEEDAKQLTQHGCKFLFEGGLALTASSSRLRQQASGPQSHNHAAQGDA